MSAYREHGTAACQPLAAAAHWPAACLAAALWSELHPSRSPAARQPLASCSPAARQLLASCSPAICLPLASCLPSLASCSLATRKLLACQPLASRSPESRQPSASRSPATCSRLPAVTSPSPSIRAQLGHVGCADVGSFSVRCECRMAKGGLGECFAACVQRGGSEFRRQVCACVAQQSTGRDRAQLGRVGCLCVGGSSLCVLSVGSRGPGCRECFAECSAQRVRVFGARGEGGGGGGQRSTSG